MNRTHARRPSSRPSSQQPFFKKGAATKTAQAFFPTVQRMAEPTQLPDEEDPQIQMQVGESTVQTMTEDEEEFAQTQALPTTMVQRKCAACEQEQQQSALQPKLTVGQPNDQYEQEANRVADQVVSQMAAPQSPRVQPQRLATPPRITPWVMRQGEGKATTSPQTAQQIQQTRGLGQSLDRTTRSSMEQAFGADFSNVRVHADGNAHQLNQSLNARAFTTGQDIYFKQGEYQPNSQTGQKLLAHELTHVVQQDQTVQGVISRFCDDPDFCTPYDTQAEIDDAEWWIRNTYLRLEGIETFGTDVKSLYESFLDRSPGDSLTPRVFDDRNGYVVSSFKDSWDTKDDMDAVIDLIGARLSRLSQPLRPNRRVLVSLSNFLSEDEMNNRPINYSNPLSVAGHIAGGIGRSDAGPDYRKIDFANVGLEKVVLFGETGYVKVQLYPKYEVFDAIDFCPGDCGSPAEQLVTIPMSRLEESGAAYDVPFKVIFWPESRSKRFWF